MTIQELIDWLGNNQNSVLWYFGGILVLTLLLLLIVNRNNFATTRYLMSAVVFAVTIPGILAVLLTLYALLIQRTSILEVNMLAYFVPIVAMALVLFLLNKKVSMSKIPGFDKLSALMLIIGIAFILVFVLQRMFFGIFFVGGFGQLIGVFLVILVVLKFAWSKLTK